MTEFHEKLGEKEGQRTKRFLEFLRSLPYKPIEAKKKPIEEEKK
jgi:hypothetical protein